MFLEFGVFSEFSIHYRFFPTSTTFCFSFTQTFQIDRRFSLILAIRCSRVSLLVAKLWQARQMACSHFLSGKHTVLISFR